MKFMKQFFQYVKHFAVALRTFNRFIQQTNDRSEEKFYKWSIWSFVASCYVHLLRFSIFLVIKRLKWTSYSVVDEVKTVGVDDLVADGVETEAVDDSEVLSNKSSFSSSVVCIIWLLQMPKKNLYDLK